MIKLDYKALRAKIKIPIITIYDHPIDYPDKFVARVFNLRCPTMICWTGNTIDDVRAAIPDEMTRHPRMAGDDPSIVETWI